MTQPTLIFCCDPKVFIAFEDKMPYFKNESYLWLRFAVLSYVEHKIPHNPHLLPICTFFYCYLDVKEAKLVGKKFGHDFFKEKKK